MKPRTQNLCCRLRFPKADLEMELGISICKMSVKRAEGDTGSKENCWLLPKSAGSSGGKNCPSELLWICLCWLKLDIPSLVSHGLWASRKESEMEGEFSVSYCLVQEDSFEQRQPLKGLSSLPAAGEFE